MLLAQSHRQFSPLQEVFLALLLTTVGHQTHSSSAKALTTQAYLSLAYPSIPALRNIKKKFHFSYQEHSIPIMNFSSITSPNELDQSGKLLQTGFLICTDLFILPKNQTALVINWKNTALLALTVGVSRKQPPLSLFLLGCEIKTGW